MNRPRTLAPRARAIATITAAALVAMLSLRYLVPTPTEAEATRLEATARFAQEHLVVLGAALFVGFAAIASYWTRVLFEAPEDRNDAPAALDRRRRFTGWSWAAVVLAAGLALAARNALGIYRVDSASMLPTLEPLDVVGGSRRGHGGGLITAKPLRLPERGELVVFEKPPGVDGPPLLVKRVVGLPGDHIAMEGALPVINGQRVRSCEAGPYLYPLSAGGGVAGRVFVEFLGNHPHLAMYAPVSDAWKGSYDVPPGEVFVVGDNRNNSSDSRSWNGGKGAGLPLGSIEARVARRLFSAERDGRVTLGDFTRPLELTVGLRGMDTSLLRDGIRRCLGQAAAAPAPARAPSLWPTWPAERWFHFGDGRPIVLDEPVLGQSARRE